MTYLSSFPWAFSCRSPVSVLTTVPRMLRSSCSLLFSMISATLGSSSAHNCRDICSHKCLMSLDPASFYCWQKAQEHLRFSLRIIHHLSLSTKLLSSCSVFIKGTAFPAVAQAGSSGQWGRVLTSVGNTVRWRFAE